MGTAKPLDHVADPAGAGVYRAGGISALLVGIGYIAIIAVYATVGAPPAGGEARLQNLAGKTTAWWAIVGLSVLTDVLFIPVAWALYLALRGINRGAMLMGASAMGLFVVLDLAVTWPNYAVLITLSGPYAAAATAAQRAAYVAAADYASAVLGSTLWTVYSIGILSLGILLIGLVMLRGAFAKATAFVGVATGVVGVGSVIGPMFVSALSAGAIVTSALTIVWVVLVGFGLLRLGRR